MPFLNTQLNKEPNNPSRRFPWSRSSTSQTSAIMAWQSMKMATLSTPISTALTSTSQGWAGFSKNHSSADRTQPQPMAARKTSFLPNRTESLAIKGAKTMLAASWMVMCQPSSTLPAVLSPPYR